MKALGKSRFKSAVRTAILSAGVLLTCCQILRAATLSETDRIFQIRIETDKPTYKIGEDIRLRLFITNTASSESMVYALPPWALCKLLVFDAAGQPVPGVGMGSARGLMEFWRFPPGATMAAEYQNPNPPYDIGLQWAGLAYWGYYLTKPGGYTLVALPKLRAFGKTSQGTAGFVTSGANKSNTVRIQIVP
jgi:hypothetical protein